MTLPSSDDVERRVTIVVPGPLTTPTGGYAYDRHVVEGLRARGWVVRVAQLDGAGFPFPSAGGLAAAAAALATEPDGALVLCDGLAFGAMPEAAAAHGERLRLVALVHHPLAAETGLRPQTAAALFESERRALRATRGVVVTSRATAAMLAGYDVPAERITVAEPGTLPAAAAHGTRAVDPAAPVQLLCVATLVPRKGHRLLIEALDRLRELPWRLACVGSLDLDPATADGVRTLVRERRLDDRVTFSGAAEGAALARAYAAADVLVQPSFYEGYGMAVAEGVARGLPVVGSRTGALEQLVDERSGVPVPPGDVDALVQALALVIGDDARRHRMAAAARVRAAALPTWADTAAGIEAALLGARHGTVLG